MDSLSPETRADAATIERLARYGSVDDLAKAYMVTEKWATGRVALPKAGDEASRAEFYAKVRPATEAEYKFALPEGTPDGQSTPMIDAFRPFAHRIGLDAYQAEEISKWWNGQQAEAIGQAGQAARDELKALELEISPVGYNRRVAAVEAMLGQVQGFDADKVGKALTGLESAMGARPAMELLFHFAQATGELEKVDGAAIDLRMGTLSPEAAQQQINAKMGDAEFMRKAATAGTPEAQQWKAWNAAAAAKAG
jgi:hypothetical protein